jgi:hypothetical protein
MAIKRYRIVPYKLSPAEHPDGEWVSFEDYAEEKNKLQRDLDALRECVDLQHEQINKLREMKGGK